MQLTLLTFDQFVAGMVAQAQASSTAALNFEEGSVLLALFQAQAAQMCWLQWQNVQNLANQRLSTCTGTDCDTFGADFGFIRLGATYATGNVTFSRLVTTQQALVPVGTLVKTGDGTQGFTVTLDAGNASYLADGTGLTQGWYVIAAGASSVTVPVVAVNGGTAGNVLAGTITLISAGIPYVDSVTNGAAFTNGVNAESDAAFKARFALFLPGLARGTATAVESAVASVAADLTYNVVEAVNASDATQPGNFVVAVDDGSGATPSATLALVTAAVNAVRPIGSTFNVLAASDVAATVSMTITCPTAAQKTAAIPLVQSAVAAFIEALPVGVPFPYSRIAALAYGASSAITDVTNITLNGGTADLGGGVFQVVRLATCTVS
jgi:uncharacterized phage protein gp47/JayE